jgi:hypothetical protein
MPISGILSPRKDRPMRIVAVPALALMFASLVGCGGSDPRDVEEKAVAALRQAGGKSCVTVDAERRAVKVQLGGKDLGDAPLVHLKAMPLLRAVDLRKMNITDAGLANLQGLTQLQNLSLYDNNGITDAGLANLKNAKGLRELDLGDTPIGDAGLEQLTGLTQLQFLNLDKTKVTSTGMGHLKGMANLGKLRLNDTAVDDAGLEHLKGLSKLKELFVQDAKVTEEGGENFKKAMPKTQINR